MNQLYSKEAWLTFESNGIPPLFQFFCDEVYLPPGNVLLYRNGVWREYIFLSILSDLNQEGKRVFKDDTLLKEAYALTVTKDEELRELSSRIQDMFEISQEDVVRLFSLIREYLAPYRYFDTWFSDGGYQNRADPQVTAALEFAGATKNVIRESLTALFFEAGKGVPAALEHIGWLHDVAIDDLNWYTPEEVLGLVSGGIVLPQEKLAGRRRAYVHYTDIDGATTLLEGDEAEAYIDIFESDRVNLEVFDSVKGMTANGTGIVVGTVHIIVSDYIDFAKTERAMNAMEEGMIMVSTTTAPDLLPTMKKAAAIVTDLGGMLSHAAITARELDTPCIVGTKYATQVFKDGDRVEVDANTGIVRILSRV